MEWSQEHNFVVIKYLVSKPPKNKIVMYESMQQYTQPDLSYSSEQQIS